MNWSSERVNNAVVKVNCDYTGKGWEQWFMLKSDDHWDNPKCKRKRLKRDLERAKERDAGVIGVGDLFCAMQGKYDKRGSKSDIRPEHNNGRYLDSLVDTAVDWYAPYADNMICEGRGNHESAIIKNHETDLTDRFCSGLRSKTGSGTEAMGYGYWVRFQLRRGLQTKSYMMKCYHGSGGGGPVTKGVIQTNRRAVFLPDATFVASGHIHEAWAVCLKRERINKSNNVSHDSQWHITTPTYKEEYGDGEKGWHIERGGPPKPIGCFWLRFYFQDDQFKYDIIPDVENDISIT